MNSTVCPVCRGQLRRLYARRTYRAKYSGSPYRAYVRVGEHCDDCTNVWLDVDQPIPFTTANEEAA